MLIFYQGNALALSQTHISPNMVKSCGAGGPPCFKPFRIDGLRLLVVNIVKFLYTPYLGGIAGLLCTVLKWIDGLQGFATFSH